MNATATKPKTIASWPPLAQPEPAWATDSLLIRFATKVHEAPSGCWEWQGAKNRAGYGQLSVGTGSEKKRVGAHRLSYQLYKGEIPDGMCVCHSCDNPACVNPDHLWIGTNADNTQDKVNKGRQNKGMNSPTAKFPPEVIEAVRAERAKHGTPYLELGDKYGMGTWSAWAICNDPNHRKHDAPLAKVNMGQRHRNSKVPVATIKAVRQDRAENGTEYRVLAERYGISVAAAYRFCTDPNTRPDAR